MQSTELTGGASRAVLPCADLPKGNIISDSLGGQGSLSGLENGAESPGVENTQTVEEQEARLVELNIAIKKVRNTITTAKYRIHRKIGRMETSERNLQTAEAELERLLEESNALKGKPAENESRGEIPANDTLKYGKESGQT